MDLQGTGTVIREGEPAGYVYILRSGDVEVTRGGGRVALLKRGDFVGSVQLLQMNKPEAYTFSHWDTVSLFGMKAEDMKKFIGNNPGLLMKLVYDFNLAAPA